MEKTFPKSIKDVNQIAKQYGFKLYHGEGYYYAILENEEMTKKLSQNDFSIYVYHYSQLSIEKWHNAFQFALKKFHDEINDK